MKKLQVIKAKLPVLLPLIILFFYFGCMSNTVNEERSAGTNKTNEINNTQKIHETPVMPYNVQAYTSSPPVSSRNPARQLVNDLAIEAAFTLDYRPLRAEPVNEAEFLSSADISGSAAAGSQQQNIAGGGLRRLSDYQTVYFDPAREAARIQEIRTAQEASRPGNEEIQGVNKEALTVIDWGPRGNFSSAIQRPSIYIIFSQPMIPLASLGEPSAASPIV